MNGNSTDSLSRLQVPFFASAEMIAECYIYRRDIGRLFESRWRNIGCWYGSDPAEVVKQAISVAQTHPHRTLLREDHSDALSELRSLLTKVRKGRFPTHPLGPAPPTSAEGLDASLFTHSYPAVVELGGPQWPGILADLFRGSARIEILDPWLLSIHSADIGLATKIGDWALLLGDSLKTLVFKTCGGESGQPKNAFRASRQEADGVRSFWLRRAEDFVATVGSAISGRGTEADVEIVVYPRGAFHDRYIIGRSEDASVAATLSGGISKTLCWPQESQSRKTTAVARIDAARVQVLVDCLDSERKHESWQLIDVRRGSGWS